MVPPDLTLVYRIAGTEWVQDMHYNRIFTGYFNY